MHCSNFVVVLAASSFTSEAWWRFNVIQGRRLWCRCQPHYTYSSTTVQQNCGRNWCCFLDVPCIKIMSSIVCPWNQVIENAIVEYDELRAIASIIKTQTIGNKL